MTDNFCNFLCDLRFETALFKSFCSIFLLVWDISKKIHITHQGQTSKLFLEFLLVDVIWASVQLVEEYYYQSQQPRENSILSNCVNFIIFFHYYRPGFHFGKIIWRKNYLFFELNFGILFEKFENKKNWNQWIGITRNLFRSYLETFNRTD